MIVSRQTMKNLAALAFIPPQNIIEEFIRIKENTSEVLDGKCASFERFKGK